MTGRPGRAGAGEAWERRFHVQRDNKEQNTEKTRLKVHSSFCLVLTSWRQQASAISARSVFVQREKRQRSQRRRWQGWIMHNRAANNSAFQLVYMTPARCPVACGVYAV